MRVWNAETLEELGPGLKGHSLWMCNLTSIRLESRMVLAATGYDGRVQLWDVETRQPLASAFAIARPGLTVASFSESTTGDVELVTAGVDRIIRIWDPTTLAEKAAIQTDLPTEVWKLVVSTTDLGERVAYVASFDGSVQGINLESGAPIAPPSKLHGRAIRGMCLWRASSGKMAIATASYDSRIGLWHQDLTEYRPFLIGHDGGVRSVIDVSHDQTPRLASVGWDGSLRIWDPDEGLEVVDARFGHLDACRVISAWSNSECIQGFAVAGDESKVRCWNAETGSPYEPPLLGSESGTMSLSSLDDGKVCIIAAGSKDGTIHVWDAGQAAPRSSFMAHRAGVNSLHIFTDGQGETRLVSGSYDGEVKVWDDSGKQIGVSLGGHQGWVSVSALSATGPELNIVSSDNSPFLRVWDGSSSQPVRIIDAGHSGWIRHLIAFQWRESVLIATASHDGTAKIADLRSGRVITTYIGHDAPLTTLTWWTDAAGNLRIASADNTGKMHRWNPWTGEQVGDALAAHSAEVGAIAGWRRGPAHRVISAGYDARIRLWDLERGVALRTIEIGALTVFGASDRPATSDALGRSQLSMALSRQLTVHRENQDIGPDVVTIDGPWGSGKTSLMRAIQASIEPAPTPSDIRESRLTVLQAYWLTRVRVGRIGFKARRALDASDRRIATAWFNPWMHQSGEQVWAGLTAAILDAAEPILYPDVANRERYWFLKNRERINTRLLRKALRRGSVSPLFNLALAALVVSIGVGLLRLADSGNSSERLIMWVGAMFAIFLTVGFTHTLFRFCFGAAAEHLPAQMLSGPIPFDAGDAVGGDWTADPFHKAGAGSLYMRQHDVDVVLKDLHDSGCELVIFIDDLDRCRPETTADVLEAVNLFLYGLEAGNAQARFVIGMDSGVIAGQIDQLFSSSPESHLLKLGDDPTAGWSFLRKMIQMPVLVPTIDKGHIAGYIDATLGTPGLSVTASVPTRRLGSESRASVDAHIAAPSTSHAESSGSRVDLSAVDASEIARGSQSLVSEGAEVSLTAMLGGDEAVPWRQLQDHPHVRMAILDLISAHSSVSPREVKRLLNVWQLYERLLEGDEPLPSTRDVLSRTQVLLRLADLVTRWPALQRDLHSNLDGERVLTLLVRAGDLAEFDSIVSRCALLSDPKNRRALANLRTFLEDPSSSSMASYAHRLL